MPGNNFRNPIYFFWVRRKGLLYRRKKDKIGFIVMLSITIIILMLMISYLNSQLMPIVVALSEAEAKHMATVIATDVVSEKLKDLKYDDLIYLQKDANSKVTALQANIVKMNQISSEIASSMQERLAGVDDMYVKVPVGNMFGSSFFSNRGPELTVKVVPYGNIDVDFKTEFVSAGINQTRHKIYIEIKSKMLVIVPLVKRGAEVVTNVPVAETVIVGDVPDSFINVEGVR